MPRPCQHDETIGPDKRTWAISLALILLALLIRGGALAVMPGGLAEDPDGYRMLAEQLRRTGVLGVPRAGPDGRVAARPTAFRPPLYPLLLAGLADQGQISATAVAVLHLFLGIGTVALVLLTARRYGLGWSSWLAALLVACDPILLNQSNQVMTETLATLLAVLALYTLAVADRDSHPAAAGIAGAVMAMASLCRPTFLAWLAVVGIGLSLRRGGRRAAAQALFFFLCTGLVLVPWAARNYHAFGRWKLTTTHGGYTLLLGNNPSFYRFLRQAPSGTTWDATPLARAWQKRSFARDHQDDCWRDLEQFAARINPAGGEITRSELQDDRLAYALAFRYIREEPGMFLAACFVRVVRFWRLVPHPTGSESTGRRALRLAVGLWYAIVFLLAALGIASLRGGVVRSPWLWGLLLCACFTAAHAVYWSNMRMRAPLMPFVAMLAAAGVLRITRARQPHELTRSQAGGGNPAGSREGGSETEPGGTTSCPP